MDRIEVITRKERRRSYSDAEKLAIVAASLRPGIKTRAFCDQYDIVPSVLYRWRREVKNGALAAGSPPFVPVQIEDQTCARDHSGSGVISGRTALEITLPNKVILRIDEAIDEKVLRRIVSAVAFVRS